MATTCPACKELTLEVREYGVCCKGYLPKKDGKEYYNSGTCNFRINYEQKVFDKKLSKGDIKTLIEGGELKNKKGDVMKMVQDPSPNDDFFTEIEWKEKNYQDF